MLFEGHFLINLLCSLVPCNSQYSYPSDPLNTRSSLLFSGRSGRIIDGENELQFDTHPIVATNTGEVQGYTMKTIRGRSIYAFEGIPYGESTGGINRFQPPLPKRKWTGVRKAFKPGNICLQTYHLRVPLIQGKEDCLFLSIYTTRESVEEPRSRKLPVLFFLHGGSFAYGGSSDFGPAYMLERDVVVVTVNYRLGLFGFLSTGDDVVPGNNGLKDQALALKWVYDNIDNFGGNKSLITLMGQSAGAASVHLHMVSSYYNDIKHKYFSRVIPMSGSSFSYWALRSPEKNQELNKQLARRTRCPVPNGLNSKEFVDCLSRRDPNVLSGVQILLYPVRVAPIILFGPVIEKSQRLTGTFHTGRPFLSQHPDQVYGNKEAAQVPMLASVTSGEAYLVSWIVNGYGILGRLVFDQYWKHQAPGFLDYEYIVPKPAEITVKIQTRYFGGQSAPKVNEEVYDQIFTERAHTTASHKSIQSHSQYAPTYAMLISGPIEKSMSSAYGIKTKPRGVLHADDVMILFNSSLVVDGLKTTDPDFELSEILSEIVVNFAIDGVPSYAAQGQDGNDIFQVVNDPCNVQYMNVSLHNPSQLVKMSKKTLENYDFWLTLGLEDLEQSPYVPLPTCSSRKI